MKIKQTRQVRLDELIKHCIDNDTFGSKGVFTSITGKVNVTVYKDDVVIEDAYTDFNITKTFFTITEEVDITEDTVIDLAYRIETEKGWKTFDKHGVTINKIIDTYKKHINVYLGFIYLLNDDCGIGDLIWTKERGLID